MHQYKKQTSPNTSKDVKKAAWPRVPPLRPHCLLPHQACSLNSCYCIPFKLRAQYRQKASPFRESDILNQQLKCGTKAFFLQRHFQNLRTYVAAPRAPPQQLNCTERSELPASPKASPDYGADRRGPALGLQHKCRLWSRLLLSSNIMQISKSN